MFYVLAWNKRGKHSLVIQNARKEDAENLARALNSLIPENRYFVYRQK